jgi:two-component system, chemotaxis family, chemotaxis protein CheY
VLVVDDDPGIRDSLEWILTHEGYRVSLATNGDAGLEALRRERPDVILLDEQMPVMDGWGFRAAQLERPEARDIPVVLVTGSGRVEPPRAELAPTAALPKPCGVDQLLTTLEKVLGSAAAPRRRSSTRPGAEPGAPPDAAPGGAPP